MIEIAQPGQAGKTSLLFDMHRLRNRVFKERLGWNVHTDMNGLEIDEFDIPEAVYMLAVENTRVVGSFRLLKSTGSTMTYGVWPQFLQTLNMPQRPDIWEVSRFAVSPLGGDRDASAAFRITAEMFCGLAELALQVGIKQLFAIYDDRLAKVLDRIDCRPFGLSKDLIIGGNPTRLGGYNTDHEMLVRLRAATGIDRPVLNSTELPPIFQPSWSEAAYA